MTSTPGARQRLPVGGYANTELEFDEATDKRYPAVDDDGFRSFFKEEGYLVLREVVPPAMCDAIHAAFLERVKPYPGPILRQATARKAPNIITPEGVMINSILSIQDLAVDPQFEPFVGATMAALAHPPVQRAVRKLLGEESAPKLCETMYFEGSRGVQLHADAHYMNSETGRLLGLWVALEDISLGAGRLFLYPKSHVLPADPAHRERYAEYERVSNETTAQFRDKTPMQNIAQRRQAQKLLIEMLDEAKLVCTAPALKKGDMVLWDGLTVHGSFNPTEQRTRNSITAHFIPAGDEFLMHGKKATMELREIAGVTAYCNP